MGLGQVDHHEAATTRTGDEWVSHSQRARRRNGGIDSVAAMLQHRDARLARVQVHGRYGAPRADRDRLLPGAG